MWDLFTKKGVECDFRIKSLRLPCHRFGKNSLKFKGILLWNSLSDEVKTAQSLAIFTQKLNAVMALISRAASAETGQWYNYFILLHFFLCKLS